MIWLPESEKILHLTAALPLLNYCKFALFIETLGIICLHGWSTKSKKPSHECLAIGEVLAYRGVVCFHCLQATQSRHARQASMASVIEQYWTNDAIL